MRNMKHKTPILLLALALPLSHLANAQRDRQEGRRAGTTGPVEVHEAPETAAIAWFGTWEEALAEATRTGRPILFQSTAPQCRSVPGVW